MSKRYSLAQIAAARIVVTKDGKLLKSNTPLADDDILVVDDELAMRGGGCNAASGNGGPAYPADYFSPEVFRDLRESEGTHTAAKMASGKSPGMSLRDWFAGQALAGLLSANAMYGGRTDNRAACAADAYRFADAMIAERAKAGA